MHILPDPKYKRIIAVIFALTLTLLALISHAQFAPRSTAEVTHRSAQQTATALTTEKLFPVNISRWFQLQSRELSSQALTELMGNDTYSQTWEAVYVGDNNQIVMLSVSYGKNQLDSRFNAHRPEYCYRSQGFQVTHLSDQHNNINGHAIKLRELVASKPGRDEFISYWMTINKEPVLPGIDRLIKQVKAGISVAINGVIPDGYLVRISSLSSTSSDEHAAQTHQAFLTAWANALSSRQARELNLSALRTRRGDHHES